MTAYYNDNDASAAGWLRELIADGLIAPGDVDERSITDVSPSDLRGYRQVHLFAGIGGWSYALRLAGLPDDFPCWTGSCPCQPFSVAGKRGGATDARHLWPEFARLLRECRPPVVFGEQVASAAGREWLAGVCADLEGMGYRVGAADLCAAGIGSPHIRQRLYWGGWLADAKRERGGAAGKLRELAAVRGGEPMERMSPARPGSRGRMGNAAGAGCEGREPQPDGEEFAPTERGRVAGRVAATLPAERRAYEPERGAAGRAADGRYRPWDDAYWHLCRDGKHRRVPAEPALFPLANGLPGRVGLLRGAGNAIVPQVAATFVQAFLESVEDCKP